MDAAQLPELAREFVEALAVLLRPGEAPAAGSLAARAWTMVQGRFAGKRAAEAALTLFEMQASQPEVQLLLRQHITSVFQGDPAGTAELGALVEELRRSQPAAPEPQRSHTQQISGNAQVGTAISGDVHGPIRVGGTTYRTVNTGGGDYAEGNIDKSRRVIVGGAGATMPKAASEGRTGRGPLPATLSADGIHFSYGHALLIGVGEYANGAYNAPTTANDAARLAELLRDAERAAYPAGQVSLLQKRDASRAAILDALSALTEQLATLQAQPQRPTVVLYFAGHGLRRDGTFYLLPYDYSGDAQASAISARTFRAKVQALADQCQKLVVLLNCCYAGGTAERVLSAESAPPSDAPTRDFVEALGQGSGQVVISSSRSEQPSSAEAQDDPGLTTFGSLLVRGLRGEAPGAGPAVGVLDLFAHLAATVPADARGITYNGKPLDQHPLLFARAVDQNFPIALRPVGRAGGTLDAEQADLVRRLAEIEIALFGYDRDDDAPALVQERDTLLGRLAQS